MTYAQRYANVLNAQFLHEPSSDTYYTMVIEKKGKKKTAVFEFQETMTLLNWIQNFMFKKKAYRNMPIPWKVHRGFLYKWKGIEESVMEFIEDNKPDNIRIDGYSQGAALALLCYEDIWFQYPKYRDGRIDGAGFACPRVVSWGAPSKRWDNFVRLNNKRDIVTKVPLIVMGYKHVGHEIVLDKISEVEDEDEQGNTGGILDSVLDFWDKVKQFIPTHVYHHPKEYRKNLEGL